MKIVKSYIKQYGRYLLPSILLAWQGVCQIRLEFSETLPTAEDLYPGNYPSFARELLSGSPGMTPADMGWSEWRYQMVYLLYPYVLILISLVIGIAGIRKWQQRKTEKFIEKEANLLHEVEKIWPPAPINKV